MQQQLPVSQSDRNGHPSCDNQGSEQRVNSATKILGLIALPHPLHTERILRIGSCNAQDAALLRNGYQAIMPKDAYFPQRKVCLQRGAFHAILSSKPKTVQKQYQLNPSTRMFARARFRFRIAGR